MGLKICTLASGSKGNCTYISDGKTSVLADVGLSYRELKDRAAQAGISLAEVSAILSTHCHIDHCRGMRTFTRRHDIPVYSHAAGTTSLKRYALIEDKNLSSFNGGFTVGSLYIEPFELSHDAPHCSGFSVSSGNCRMSIATDLGTYRGALQNMFGSDLVMLESNHDREMLINGSYPPALKRRILSDYGHLCNDDCGTAAVKLLEKGTKYFILAHLSEENNLPELAFACLTDSLSKSGAGGKDYVASVALQHSVSEIIEI